MDAAVVGVLGTIVGALGGLGGGWISIRGQRQHQREQLEEERYRNLHNVRIEAYSGYLSAVRVLNGQLWKLFDELTAPDSSPAVWKDHLSEMHQCWVTLSATASRVSMIGPRDVATEAELLHHSMREWHVLCSEWARTAIRVGSPPQGNEEACFREAADAKRVRIGVFQEAARQALRTNV
ncbi:hypothetical protein [Streptomyces sp. SID13726]|uniref:hypothetical protein n=1 Tax=Streptomyces sp. SID13726 TaxID=2706058 RepID=UPI0013BDEDD9|nr:hypothetical protein [Streptomyces sp. SID13726]NEA98953.1 hypothetical protein [Streptomyces sp. SID13726]